MNVTQLTDTITAWGETKTVAEWANDPRATANAAIIAKRYDSGSLAESAIGFRKTRSAAVISQFAEDQYAAFGKSKTLRAWANDPICKVNLKSLNYRLKCGWTLEDALSKPSQTQAASFLITAWRVTRSIEQWLTDPRCKVSGRTIKKRLRAGETPENAISTPCPEESALKAIRAFGETKSVLEWSNDSRCKTTCAGLRCRILAGTDPEKAITTPSTRPGSQKGVSKGRRVFHEYDGKKLTLNEWTKQPICKVSFTTLRLRMAKGMPLLEAMTTPSTSRAHSHPQKGNLDVAEYTGFGETKPLAQWFQDPRCKVHKSAVRSRLKLGYNIEDAITTEAQGLVNGKVRELYEAFGEQKTLVEWGRDPRNASTSQTLHMRMDKGWNFEAALTTPPKEFHPTRPRGFIRITAFGETKCLKEWAEDPRCTVCAKTIQQRLDKGMTTEEAISTKPEARLLGRKKAA